MTITDKDQILAVIALKELAERRLEVVLVPCDSGTGKKRVSTNQNPEWYRAFLDRRRYPTRWRCGNGAQRQSQRKRPRSGGRRQDVQRALERIRDNRPNPQRRWIGWELIELLRDHDARDRR